MAVALEKSFQLLHLIKSKGRDRKRWTNKLQKPDYYRVVFFLRLNFTLLCPNSNCYQICLKEERTALLSSLRQSNHFESLQALKSLTILPPTKNTALKHHCFSWDLKIEMTHQTTTTPVPEEAEDQNGHLGVPRWQLYR